MDWIGELTEDHAEELLRETLQQVADVEEVLEPEGSCAIAAAEVVAVLAGKPGDALVYEYVDWSDQWKPRDDLLALANRVVGKIMSSSEIKDLWEESEHYDEWVTKMKQIQARVAS